VLSGAGVRELCQDGREIFEEDGDRADGVEDAECEFLDVFVFSLLACADGWERGWEGNRKIKEVE